MAKGESKSYNPAANEKQIFEMWEAGGYFHPQPDDRPPEKRFCIVIPPPNVTGALHLGHALNNTLQDILIRQKRMAGFNTLWVVGTDHAGIATQATVEKTIRANEGKSRHDLGRDELVRRIWEWKEKYGGRIIEQLKLMGCSCDYQRERFTLDEGCAAAVRETFFKLFRDGLIYRGKRLVNWDTQLQTAVADDEVYHEQVKGHFYYLKYPIVGQASSSVVGQVSSPASGEPTHVLLATTRPETMLGDTAVAVHPDPAHAMDKAERDARTKLAESTDKDKAAAQARLDEIIERRSTLLPTLVKLRDMAKAGSKIALPLTDREIPLICDEWADPTLGTGCVKITPAHDPNDYQVSERHDLEKRNIMTADGRVNENGGTKYQGQKFADARKNVVADLEALGLVERIEERLIDVGHSDRSKSPIEPYLSDQWFVRMGDLTTEEVARIQTPELKSYIQRASAKQSEPRPSGSGRNALESTSHLDQSGSAETRSATSVASSGAVIPLPHGRGSDRDPFPGLAQMAIDAVKNGDVSIHPTRYENTYLDWLGEKRDWCISRQLWWGHRIPVWTLTENKLIDGMRAQFPPDFEDRLLKYFTFLGVGEDVAIRWDAHSRKLHVCLRSDKSQPAFDALVQWLFATLGDEDFFFESYEKKKFKSDEHRKAHEIVVDFLGLTELPEQDPDVLDTWFSSALWPHSTLGWPEKTNCGAGLLTGHAHAKDRSGDRSHKPAAGQSNESLLDYYYPTQVLSTAREIITLWVARMVITGLYNIGDVPFKDVFIHQVIQDGAGKKMSKTAGNGVDPADIIEEYGADALRFTLADLATETQDIRMPVKPKKLPDGRSINISEKFEKGRNFCNKLWQASTGFVMTNLDGYAPKPLDLTGKSPTSQLPLADRWILSRMTGCLQDLNAALEKFRFSDAAQIVYRFMWDEYCSWYIEMVKPRLTDQSRDREGAGTPHPPSEPQSRAIAQQVVVHVLDQLLRMLHPITPFITEAIWKELNAAAPRRGLTEIREGEKVLVAAAWPTVNAALRDEPTEQRVAQLQEVIKAVRDIRTTVNDNRGKAKLPSLRTLPSVVIVGDGETRRLMDSQRDFFARLAGCDAFDASDNAVKPAKSMSRAAGAVHVYVPVADLIDLAVVRERDTAKLAELRGVLSKEDARLASEDFVKRADPGIVAQARSRVAELSSQIQTLESDLAAMS